MRVNFWLNLTLFENFHFHGNSRVSTFEPLQKIENEIQKSASDFSSGFTRLVRTQIIETSTPYSLNYGLNLKIGSPFFSTFIMKNKL